jgi:hypothetical protein
LVSIDEVIVLSPGFTVQSSGGPCCELRPGAKKARMIWSFYGGDHAARHLHVLEALFEHVAAQGLGDALLGIETVGAGLRKGLLEAP